MQHQERPPHVHLTGACPQSDKILSAASLAQVQKGERNARNRLTQTSSRTFHLHLPIYNCGGAYRDIASSPVLPVRAEAEERRPTEVESIPNVLYLPLPCVCSSSTLLRCSVPGAGLRCEPTLDATGGSAALRQPAVCTHPAGCQRVRGQLLPRRPGKGEAGSLVGRGSAHVPPRQEVPTGWIQAQTGECGTAGLCLTRLCSGSLQLSLQSA